MKKTIFTLILSAVCAVGAFAQSGEKTEMIVTMKDGSTTTFKIQDIDSISFKGETPEVTYYSIDVPTDFTGSGIVKAMYGDKAVGEFCKEYVRSWQDGKNVVDAQMVVFYPYLGSDKADLTKGYAADGSKIVWDLTGDSIASYVKGDKAGMKSFVMSADGNVIEENTENLALVEVKTFEPYVVKDKRSALDNQTYKVVKIGTQYWLASNLKATTFLDGTSIKQYQSTQADAWDALTTGAYHIYADDTEYCWLDYGAMYNGYAVLSDKGLAPEGWEVTSVDHWNAMKKYLRTGQSGKVKTTDTWKTVGNNKTGLSIAPGGYFSKATTDAGEGNDVYFWNTDKTKDSLFGTDALKTTRVVNSIMTTGTHGYGFGHYVRCVRK